MIYEEKSWRDEKGWRMALASGFAVLMAAACLCCVAFWIGYPVIIPDAVVSLRDGRGVVRMLLGSEVARVPYRAALYCAGIYLLDWNRTPWPSVAVNALLTAWSVGLVVRSVWVKKPLVMFGWLVAGLCGLTTVSWMVSAAMPDVLGAVMALGIYLLVFAPGTLARWEMVVLCGVVWWTALSHSTFLPLALGLGLFLGLLWAARTRVMAGKGMRLAGVMGLVVLALAAQTAVNTRSMRRLTVLDPHPPYLMARIVADGVSHKYLYSKCFTVNWTVCQWKDRLPWIPDEFLWSEQGVYQSATAEQKKELLKEEWPLLQGTIMAYPQEQIWVSFLNFVSQLAGFYADDTQPDNPWTNKELDSFLPGGAGDKAKVSRAVQNRMPRRFFRVMDNWVLGLAAVAVLGLLPWAWRRREVRVLGLTAVVIYMLLANAAVTGILSSGSPRYQDRVSWMLPMLAGLMVPLWWRARDVRGNAS